MLCLLTPAWARQVHSVGNCVGPLVAEAVATLPYGEILVLENTRFHKGEEANEAGFAKEVRWLWQRAQHAEHHHTAQA